MPPEDLTSEQLNELVERVDDAVNSSPSECLALRAETLVAARVAGDERIRRMIAEHDGYALAPGLVVTISIGAATRRAGESAEPLVARADVRTDPADA